MAFLRSIYYYNMLNNKKSKKQANIQTTVWTVKQLQAVYRDPQILLIDLRSSGIFRGGPPPSPKEIPREYHQGHIFLALNLNIEHAAESKDIEQEIETGANSAGGTFLDTLVLAIISGFQFLFYDQDGSNIEQFEMLKSVKIIKNNEEYSFGEDNMHWLEGLI